MNEQFTVTPHLLKREESVLVVIDIQEKLMPTIAEGKKVIANTARLLQFAGIIDLPVILSEQDKLGATVLEIRQEIAGLTPAIKITFDAMLCEAFADQLRRLNRKSIILTGVETHVCVTQTALHALPDYTVHVVSDAVSSRTRENWRVGLERMRQHGAVITSTEMVMFELLKRAGTDEFKKVLPLVK
jgi:nicotinamidase-related amidase